MSTDLIPFGELSDRITCVSDQSKGDMTRMLVSFENGYQASIIRGPYSYGGPNGLFEVGVMVNGRLTYDTPITGDVLGYLTASEVVDYARQNALPAE